MTDAARTVFDAVWAAMPDLRCEVRVGRHTMIMAKINRLLVSRENTDMGQMAVPSSIVEFPKVDAPKPNDDTGGISAGESVDVRMVGAAKWQTFRVGDVAQLGTTVVRLTLEAEYA